jgi:hypothetical protein
VKRTSTSVNSGHVETKHSYSFLLLNLHIIFPDLIPSLEIICCSTLVGKIREAVIWMTGKKT